MVKIFYTSNGQVRVTIPKALAQSLQLKHKEEVQFFVNGNDIFLRRKIGEKD